jgi:hypothetical protein
LALEGLQKVLGDNYERYVAAPEEEKRAVLIEALNANLSAS